MSTGKNLKAMTNEELVAYAEALLKNADQTKTAQDLKALLPLLAAKK